MGYEKQYWLLFVVLLLVAAIATPIVDRLLDNTSEEPDKPDIQNLTYTTNKIYKAGKYDHRDGTVLNVTSINSLNYKLQATSESANYFVNNMKCIDGSIEGTLGGEAIFLREVANGTGAFLYAIKGKENIGGLYCIGDVNLCVASQTPITINQIIRHTI